MPRRHLIKGYIAGKKGLKKVFSRNRTLRTTLGPKARKEALNTLRSFKSGGGITSRELNKSYSKWARNTDDNITRTQAKIIKRELKEYANQSEQVKKNDTRAYLDQVRSGSIRSPRPDDISTSNSTRAYLNKARDRRSGYIEPEERSSFSKDNTDSPSSFDDEATDSSLQQERPF